MVRCRFRKIQPLVPTHSQMNAVQTLISHSLLSSHPRLRLQILLFHYIHFNNITLSMLSHSKQSLITFPKLHLVTVPVSQTHVSCPQYPDNNLTTHHMTATPSRNTVTYLKKEDTMHQYFTQKQINIV